MQYSRLWAVTGLMAMAMVAVAAEGQSEEGFVSIFNGKDLSGWTVMNGKARGISATGKGELHFVGLDNWPLWLRSDKSYENFVLRFEFKLPYYSEAGLLVHAPLYGHAAAVGMKILLCEDTAPGANTQHTGTIVAVQREKQLATKHYGEWNEVEVVMDYPALRVTVNGKLVQEVDCAKNEKLWYRSRQGYLGLQAMGSPITFRNLRIRELPSKEKWITLFNGKDLTGWHKIGGARWEIKDGVLKGVGNGYVLTKEEYQDFELFTYVRTSKNANGGIFFRWKTLKTDDRGNEIQVYNNPDGNNPTGSVYTINRTENLTTRDGEWFPMQIFLKGKTVKVFVDGQPGGSTDQLKVVRPGMITLQAHSEGASVEFQDLRIKLPE